MSIGASRFTTAFNSRPCTNWAWSRLRFSLGLFLLRSTELLNHTCLTNWPRLDQLAEEWFLSPWEDGKARWGPRTHGSSICHLLRRSTMKWRSVDVQRLRSGSADGRLMDGKQKQRSPLVVSSMHRQHLRSIFRKLLCVPEDYESKVDMDTWRELVPRNDNLLIWLLAESLAQSRVMFYSP